MIAGIPPFNAWKSPPLTATTQPFTAPSTLTDNSQLLSSLISEIQSLKLQINTGAMATDHQKSNSPPQVPGPAPLNPLDPTPGQTGNLQSDLEAQIVLLQRASSTTTSEFISIRKTLADHASTTAQLTDRFDDFERYIDHQLAPLKEATAAGGLAALIRSCLSPSTSPARLPQQNDEPMEDNSVYTPRRLALARPPTTPPPESRSVSNSGRKRGERPSPFSRQGQASPSRVRLDTSSPPSFASNKQD